jgi:hypothetical protein
MEKMMRILKTTILAGGILGAAMLAFDFEGAAAADDEPEAAAPEERDRWMAAKLTSSQQILEHLTRGEFEELETSARRMQVMNFLEQWLREEDFARESEYQGQLNAFEFATKELTRHAGDENVDGALNAYVAMTESCVRCHSLIRDGGE